MTNIYINQEENTYQLLILGHAGYASSGTDIVCAAISILAYTFIARVDELVSEEKIFLKKIEEDEAMINVIVDSENLEFTGVCKYFEKGIELLEENYPGNLKVTRGEKIF